jgi:hypothetical protein
MSPVGHLSLLIEPISDDQRGVEEKKKKKKKKNEREKRARRRKKPTPQRTLAAPERRRRTSVTMDMLMRKNLLCAGDVLELHGRRACLLRDGWLEYGRETLPNLDLWIARCQKFRNDDDDDDDVWRRIKLIACRQTVDAQISQGISVERVSLHDARQAYLDPFNVRADDVRQFRSPVKVPKRRPIGSSVEDDESYNDDNGDDNNESNGKRAVAFKIDDAQDDNNDENSDDDGGGDQHLSIFDFEGSPKKAKANSAKAKLKKKEQEMRRRTCATSNVSDALVDQLRRICRRRDHMTMVRQVNRGATHLVMEAERVAERGAEWTTSRTVPYLRALLCGLWIVSYDWVVDSYMNRRWLDEAAYEIDGDFDVAPGTFAPRRAREHASNADGLLDSLYVRVHSNVECALDVEQLVVLGGGTLHSQGSETPPSMVLCDADLTAPRELDELSARFKAPVISHLWLFDVIASFDLNVPLLNSVLRA